jgi:hypothetical protein
MRAAQTKKSATEILNRKTYSTCRLRQQYDEHYNSVLSTGKRKIRKADDRVCARLYCNICRETGVKSDSTYTSTYKSQKKKVMKAGWVTKL